MSTLDMREGIAAYTRARQLEHARTWTEAEEASLRAAYARTEWGRRDIKPFEQAMAIPAMAAAIRAMALSLRHSAGELFTSEPAGTPEHP